MPSLNGSRALSTPSGVAFLVDDVRETAMGSDFSADGAQSDQPSTPPSSADDASDLTIPFEVNQAYTYAQAVGVDAKLARMVLRTTPPDLLRKLDVPRRGRGIAIDLDHSMLVLDGKRFLFARLIIEHPDGKVTSTGGPMFDDGGRLAWSGIVPMENGAGVRVRYGRGTLGPSRPPALDLDLVVPELDETGDTLVARLDTSTTPPTITVIAASDTTSSPAVWNDCEPEWAVEQINRLSDYAVVYPDDVDRSWQATWSRIN